MTRLWTEVMGRNDTPELLEWRGEINPEVGEAVFVFFDDDWHRVYLSGWTSVLPGYDRVYLCYEWPSRPKWVEG